MLFVNFSHRWLEGLKILGLFWVLTACTLVEERIDRAAGSSDRLSSSSACSQLDSGRVTRHAPALLTRISTPPN